MESVDGWVWGLICVTTDACSAVDNFDSENEGINKSFRTHEDRKSECMREREEERIITSLSYCQHPCT